MLRWLHFGDADNIKGASLPSEVLNVSRALGLGRGCCIFETLPHAKSLARKGAATLTTANKATTAA